VPAATEALDEAFDSVRLIAGRLKIRNNFELRH
jgi:hypothetical protein